MHEHLPPVQVPPAQVVNAVGEDDNRPPERLNAVPALVLGILGFILWPCSWVGLPLAIGLRRRLRGHPYHPDRSMVTAAWVVNLVAVIAGCVVNVAFIIVIAYIAHGISNMGAGGSWIH